MTTIQIYAENRTISVSYEPFNAHEPFGIGYFVDDVKVTVHLGDERDLQRGIQESFRDALAVCTTLKGEVELEGQQIFLCKLVDRIEFDYLHQLDESLSELVLLLRQALDGVRIPYQIEAKLGCFS